MAALCLFVVPAYATAPDPGGATTVVNPTGEGAVSINEDAVQPESANIRLIVPTLTDPAGGTPNSIRILSVTGGTLWTSGGSSITLGAAGTILSLSSSRLDLRFRPDAGRDTNATFRYVVVDPHDSAVNSTASIATISITAVNDAPVLQTLSGDTGLGLAATYYLTNWDLTGPTYNRIDATINFGNNFSVPGYNAENFSARWSGQVKSPVTGNVTFSTVSDDGVRLWIDDVLIIDNWTLHGDTTDTASPVSLVADQKYTIRMEFYERGGGETARLRWAYTGQSTQIIPQAYLFPATTRPTMTYISGSASAIIDDAITVADVDSATISSGSVVISNNYQSGENSLLFTNQNGITGSYSAGTLTLLGTTTLANYQTALRSVRYANSNASPNTSTRTVQFKVKDGYDASNFTFRNITFTATNTAPVITQGTSTGVTMDQNGSPRAFALTLSATDIDFQSITWSISSPASHGTASASGAGDSIAIGYTPTTDYNGSDSFVVQASDGAGGTDTITVNVTITERNPPVITDVAAAVSGSGSAVITWTTDENASSKVNYGLASSYGASTSVTDTSPRVTSHTRTLTGLRACTIYHYAVVSADAAANSATSGDGTFMTTGCTGDATVTSGTGTAVISNANGSTGSIVLTGSSVTLSVPSGYIATNPTCPSGAHFQLKELAPLPVKDALGVPSGRATIVTAHNLSAYCPDFTPVTSFAQSLTVTFRYADADVAGLIETSLAVYRYGSGSTAWQELACSQDAAANTLTCGTTAFSSFGLFGAPVPSSSSSARSAPVAKTGGCRGSNCRSIVRPSPDRYVVSQDTTTVAAARPLACSGETVPSKNKKLWMPIEDKSVLFQDVPVAQWFACPVHHVIEKGIFQGYSDGSGNMTGRYGPSDSMTLGQLAKVAVQLAHRSVTGSTIGSRWAHPYMNAAQAMRLSAFLRKMDAATVATRGMVLQTILEALDIPLQQKARSPYADVPDGSIYASAVATATTLGIVSGDPSADSGQADQDRTFRPNAPINRAEVAKMIVLALAQKNSVPQSGGKK